VQSLLNDAHCIELRERLCETHDFAPVTDEELEVLIGHLREYSQTCAVQERYSTALQAQELVEAARWELRSRVRGRSAQDATAVQIEAGIHAQLKEEWKAARERYNTETDEKRRALQERHAHQTRVFEKLWKSEMPHKYRKPSQKLLQLKQIEKSLAVTAEVKQAFYVHEQVQARINSEAEAAQRNLIMDYKAAREKHFERQKLEMDRFEAVRREGADLLDADFRLRDEVQSNRESAARIRCERVLNRPRSAKDRPVTSRAVPRQREADFDNLLPELVPPNDEFIVACERERRNRNRERHEELQRRLDEQERALWEEVERTL
jgi:hypothetical protein